MDLMDLLEGDPSFRKTPVDQLQPIEPLNTERPGPDIVRREEIAEEGVVIQDDEVKKRKGIPTSEELQQMIANEDAAGILTAFSYETDPERKKKQTSRLGMEAIGNALSSLGGFYTAQGGAQVTPVDRSRVDAIVNEIGQEELRTTALKHDHDMTIMREALGQIKEKQRLSQLREDAATQHKQRMAEIDKGLERFTLQGDLEDKRAKDRVDLELLKGSQRMSLQQARNIPALARVSQQAETSRLANEARITQARSRDNVQANRDNPIEVAIYNPSTGRPDMLRQKETNLLFEELRRLPEVQQVLDREYRYVLQNAEASGRLPQEIKNFIVMNYWDMLPDITKSLIEGQDRKNTNDPFDILD